MWLYAIYSCHICYCRNIDVISLSTFCWIKTLTWCQSISSFIKDTLQLRVVIFDKFKVYTVCFVGGLISKFLLSSKVTFISETQNILYLFCIQAEIILLGTMYLSPDVGSRAPLGLAWGLSAKEQDRKSLVTMLVAYSGGKQATQDQLFVKVTQLCPLFVTFFIVRILDQLDNIF